MKSDRWEEMVMGEHGDPFGVNPMPTCWDEDEEDEEKIQDAMREMEDEES